MSYRKTKSELVKILTTRTTNDIKISDNSNSDLADIEFCGVEFDSRKVKDKNLFVAYQGENTHGHAFLDSAFQSGASLALIEDQELLKTSIHRERLICVPSTVDALNILAKNIRVNSPCPTLAITGSMGKTTVKAFCRSILSQYGKGTASIASYNNHIGVAYTICNSSLEDQWLVLEMGMNHAGELTELSLIGQPNIAMITSIAPAHMEFFNHIDEVCAAKLEIIAGIKKGGTLILNGEDQVLLAGFNKLKEKSHLNFNVKYYGFKPEFDLYIKHFKSHGVKGFEINYEILGQENTVMLPALGSHNVLNAAAAILGCKTLVDGLSSKNIKDGLAEFTPEKHRLNVIYLNNGKVIIDDSYNASPVAVREAINLAKELLSPNQKLGLVLGDMAELGEHTEKYHQEVAEAVIKANPEFVITVGEHSKIISDNSKKNGIPSTHCTSIESAITAARTKDYHVLLVKGSRSTGLDKVVAGLKGN